MERSMHMRTRCGWIVGFASAMLVEGVALAQSPPAPASEAPPAPTSNTPALSTAPSAAPAPAPTPTPAAYAAAAPAETPAPIAPRTPPAETPPPGAAPAEEPASEPFAYGDFTWLNGTNRQHKALLDSPLFTGSFLLDVNYTASKNHPIDNTVVGSTALSRNDEITLAFLGFGGDFHYQNARAPHDAVRR